MGQKEPSRLGSTICYGQELARKSHRDSAVRFDTAKPGPDCYGQELARKSHQDSTVRFFTAKNWPERATKTREYDLLRLNVGQKEPPRLGSTICYGQTWARKSHQDSAVRFVTAKSWPERATETRQYDLLRPNVGQKEPSRLGSTICCGQELARKSHQDSAVRFATANRKGHRDSAVRFVTAKRGPERAQDSAVRFVTAKSWPEKATKTRQYDLLRPRAGQKKPPRLGSTTCYGQTWARKSHRRFVTAKSCPERTTKTRGYDLLRPRAGQKEPPRLGSTICYGQELARNSHQDSAVRFVTANRKSHRDSAVRFVIAKRGPERATKTRQYDLLRPRVGQKEPPRLGSTICYGQELVRKSHRAICYVQELARKSHRDSAVRFVAAKNLAIKRATKTRQYDLFLARNSHQDSAVRFVTAKPGPERATKTPQYELLRPRVGQKEPPRLDSPICYGEE